MADPLCDWNDGIFTVETTEVSRAGGGADFIALMAALAVLVTGQRSATQLARAGLVAGDEKALSVADGLFASASSHGPRTTSDIAPTKRDHGSPCQAPMGPLGEAHPVSIEELAPGGPLWRAG